MIWFKKNNRETMPENRRFERQTPEDVFLVEFQNVSAVKARLGQGKDISLGGIRFATSAPLKKGEQLQMTVYFPKKFPGPRKVKTEALVHRVYNPGASHRLRVACEFMEKTPLAEAALNSYLDWSKTQDLTPAG